MKVLICFSASKEKNIDVLPEVVDVLSGNGMIPVMQEKNRSFFSDGRVTYTADSGVMRECDIVLTVGGDGTILKWGRSAAEENKPLIGVNTGRLGFMTALSCDEIHKLSALMDGGFTVTKRLLLETSLNGEKRQNALNDVVFFKEQGSKLPEYIVRVNDIMVTKIRADGIIFSTPTGSTAYALAAGGPLIEPTAECIELTPLCAHSLMSRPMIFNANDIITVSYNSYENSRVSVSIDGGSGVELSDSDVFRIERSDLTLSLIDIGAHNFYDAVNNKLMAPLK